MQELVVESAERQRVADCGVGRCRTSEPAGCWLAARFSTGGSEIRPYHVPTESLVFGMLLDELVDQIHGFQRVGRDPL